MARRAAFDGFSNEEAPTLCKPLLAAFGPGHRIRQAKRLHGAGLDLSSDKKSRRKVQKATLALVSRCERARAEACPKRSRHRNAAADEPSRRLDARERV